MRTSRKTSETDGATFAGDATVFPWSESIAYLLRDTYRAFAQVLQRELERYNVNVGSWLYLRVLWNEDGLTQRELTRGVGLMQPNTNAALTQLSRRGLIRQTTDPKDRRRINIFLTPEGRALGRSLIPAAKKIRERSVAGFRKGDVDRLVAMLARMKRNLTDKNIGAESSSDVGRQNGRSKKPVTRRLSPQSGRAGRANGALRPTASRGP